MVRGLKAIVFLLLISVNWFGVVVRVITDEPITRYIRRRPIKQAVAIPSWVILKNPI